MEASSSQTPTHGQNPFETVDYDDLALSFTNLGLDETTHHHESTSSGCNNGSSSYRVNDGVADDDAPVSALQKLKAKSTSFPIDFYVDKYLNTVFTPIPAESSSHEQSGLMNMNSSYNYSSTISNPENQFISSTNPLQYSYDPRLRPMGNIDTLQNYQFCEIENNGFCSCYEYYTMNSPHIILNCLQKALEGGDCVKIDRLLSILQADVFSLMTNESMYYVFHKFVDACEGERLSLLVQQLSWGRELFIKAAFYKQGVSSIIKLIKKLKKTVHAFTVTEILSTKFFEIMTHCTARDVILQCLNFFGPAPNTILYEKTINHFPELAVHEYGYRSLTECINTITGEHRSILLNHIAYISDYLSNDPYGNFIVQHVLKLKNHDVTCKILSRLQSQFIELAKKKCGSHVVETCMESSDFGIHFVLREILECPKAPIQLAQNQFGNYVIQKALRNTKEKGFTGLYRSLVQCLEPYSMVLNRTAGGKKVIDLLRDNIQLQKRSSIEGLGSLL